METEYFLIQWHCALFLIIICQGIVSHRSKKGPSAVRDLIFGKNKKMKKKKMIFVTEQIF